MERFERNCCHKDLKCRWWMVVEREGNLAEQNWCTLAV